MILSEKILERKKIFSLAILLLSVCFLCPLKTFSQLNPNPPSNTVRLVFIHHSTGEGWLIQDVGGLITELNRNNYYVRDTNYDWGPLDEDVNDGVNIGSHTDIGHWYNWFLGPHRITYLNALYTNNFLTDGILYNDSLADPGGENTIVMFKSCFTSAQIIYGDENDPPPPQGQINPLYGHGVEVDTAYTVSNIKGLYRDLLNYFATKQDKLFIIITTPPSFPGSADEAMPKLRAINTWLVEHLLDNYAPKNVMVFDYYNVLTSNGGNPTTNDFGAVNGSHHRYRNGTIEHLIENSNFLAYPTWDDGSQSWDNHPTAAGHQKATGEFVPLLNIAYNRWKSTAPPKAHINVDHTNIDFIADSGQALPPSQTVAIINRGNASMNWSASKTNFWLSLNPTNGSTNVNDTAIVTVGVTFTNLSRGVYHDEIIITSADADNSPQKITVNYTIRTTSPPHIVLDKTQINFTADSGSTLPSPQTFTIENTGSDIMDWTITNNQPWLNIDQLNGTTNPGEGSTVTVEVNTTELESGTHRDTLTITSSNADNSPQFVIITYTINTQSLAHIAVNKQTLTFAADSGGALPQNQTLTVSNTGIGTLNWSAAKGFNWLSINPTNGSLNAGENVQINVGITTTQLQVRQYIDSIFISSTSSDNSPQHIMVIYNVVKQNRAPMNFSLISPTKTDTIKLTNPTKPLSFRWHRSVDPDAGTEVSYTFRFFGSGFDTTFAWLSDTLYAFDFMKRLRVSSQYYWCVLASDGIITTSSDTIPLVTSSTITSMKNEVRIPQSIQLFQNYPNPFTQSTAIGYRLSVEDSRASGFVRLEVFDPLGRKVATLVDDEVTAGTHSVQFEIQKTLSGIPSGVYFYQLRSGSKILTKSMVVRNRIKN